MGARKPIDWNRVYADEHPPAEAVDSRRRLRICFWGFAVLLAVVFGRATQLEVSNGAAFRAEAARPLVRHRSVPGRRGRILAQDGTVLAQDKQTPALAVHYRYLEEPPDQGWLRSMARSRLSRDEKKLPGRVAAEEETLRRERQELAARLAELCGLTPRQWAARAARVQVQVEQIARDVNRRRLAAFEQRRAEAARTRQSLLDRWLGPVEETPPAEVSVREQLQPHVMVDEVPPAVVAQIDDHPERFPGVTIVTQSRRDYPLGELAAHVLGHLGPAEPDQLDADSGEDYQEGDRRGRSGVELHYERPLRARRGRIVETTDRSGRVLSVEHECAPVVGRDLILTIDARLQRTAETLLDDGLRRRELLGAKPEDVGGAAIVLDVHTGAILAAASSPRFNPNTLAGGRAADVEAILNDPAKPLFDRAVRMAIAPGSVFKTLAAVALLEDGGLDPDATLFCRGYLETPDRLRCQIFLERGEGHGDVTLVDALAQSCNVYFFHHGPRLGAAALVDWAGRFGFGRRTGVDLPGEAEGNVPQPLADGPRQVEQARMLAVGQSTLTTTPLQIARAMAAVANGGRLVSPHVGGYIASDDAVGQPLDHPSPEPIPGVHPATLKIVRQGLEQTVISPGGTAHGTVYLDEIAIAGKTGTAETGPGRSPHAWFAGYAPADQPQCALVVVLEHAGAGGAMAGPIVQRLALTMRELGLL